MRYIDADKLMRDIDEYHLSDGKFQHWIEVQPTADVRENVHGEWQYGTYYVQGREEKWLFPNCSICHKEFDKEYNFCPNCGADMRPITALSKNAEIDSNADKCRTFFSASTS